MVDIVFALNGHIMVMQCSCDGHMTDIRSTYDGQTTGHIMDIPTDM